MESTIVNNLVQNGIKFTQVNSHTCLMEDTDWEGETTYWIGFLRMEILEGETKRRYHKVKVSKRDYEKVKAAVGVEETVNA